MLALAACAAPNTVAALDDDPVPLRFRRIEGIVVDRATGKPLPDADVRFEDDWRLVYITDDRGGYAAPTSGGSATTAVITYDGGRMFEPVVLAADRVTRHDFSFAPDPTCARKDDADLDRVFEVALVESFGHPHRRVRIVDERTRSRGNSMSMGGVDLTTLELLQDESDRSHKTIYYAYINAELVTGCTAHVTIGHSCVSPHELLNMCYEDRVWLYIKDASGWHRLEAIGGAAS